MMPPTTGAIEIERGGDENITINHGCGGGDCGGSCSSDGKTAAAAMAAAAAAAVATAATTEAEKATAALAAAGAMTAMSDDNEDDDDDDGYDNDGRQLWRRLPAPVARRSSIVCSCKLKMGTSKNCEGNPNLFLRM